MREGGGGFFLPLTFSPQAPIFGCMYKYIKKDIKIILISELLNIKNKVFPSVKCLKNWRFDIGLVSGGKKTRGAKMQVLRKQLEETKARQVTHRKLCLVYHVR